MLCQSLQQDRFLKNDYQTWERIQKTQMILLFGKLISYQNILAVSFIMS